MITAKDKIALDRAAAHADRNHDGHVTILKFTTNWRVCFGTPIFLDPHEEIHQMASGKTLSYAVEKAIKTDNKTKFKG